MIQCRLFFSFIEKFAGDIPSEITYVNQIYNSFTILGTINIANCLLHFSSAIDWLRSSCDSNKASIYFEICDEAWNFQLLKLLGQLKRLTFLPNALQAIMKKGNKRVTVYICISIMPTTLGSLLQPDLFLIFLELVISTFFKGLWFRTTVWC